MLKVVGIFVISINMCINAVASFTVDDSYSWSNLRWLWGKKCHIVLVFFLRIYVIPYQCRLGVLALVNQSYYLFLFQVLKFARVKFNKCSESFIASNDFTQLLQTKKQEIENDPANKYLHIKNFVSVLKANAKAKKNKVDAVEQHESELTTNKRPHDSGKPCLKVLIVRVRYATCF